MLTIKNECAGSGKTYGIARDICESLNDCPNDKVIYAITHTNSATKEIYNEVVKQFQTMPKNVEIQTIDTFLLRKVIYPYSKLSLGYDYKTCSICKLNENDHYKASQIKRMRDENIIHSTKILSESLKIFKFKTKKEKKLKQYVYDFFSSEIYKLYVDETQDMDEKGIDLLKCLSNYGLNIYCVGDFRQDIRGNKAFKNLIEEAKKSELSFNGKFINKENYVFLENNETRRNPIGVLNITNRLFDKEYECTSKKSEGKTTYSYYDDDFSFEKIKKYDLCYIDKKTEVFCTNSCSNKEIYFSKDEKNILCEKFNETSNFNVEIIINQFLLYLSNSVSNYEAYKAIMKKYGFKFDKTIYYKFINYKYEQQKSGYYVQTIDKIKGAEGENCLFIATHHMLNILINNDKDNKEKNKLYVALTRTKKNLHILVYDITKDKFTNDVIDSFMRNNNIELLKI